MPISQISGATSLHRNDVQEFSQEELKKFKDSIQSIATILGGKPGGSLAGVFWAQLIKAHAERVSLAQERRSFRMSQKTEETNG